MRQRHDDRENHRGCANNRRADEHGFGRGFKRVPCAVIGFEKVLGALEVHVDVEILLQLFLDIRQLLDEGEFVDGLGIVGHGAVGNDSDGDRAHTEKAEGHQAEGKYRRGDHELSESHAADKVANGHERDHHTAEVVAREITGDEAGEDAEGGAPFLRGGDDFLDVARFDGRENLDQFGNQCTRERAAGNNCGELPPLRGVAAQRGNNQRGNDIGKRDGYEGRDPDQPGERRFEIHVRCVGVAGLLDGAVEKVGRGAGDQHDDAHDEDPDEQLDLNGGRFDREENKGDEGDTGYTVGFETVGGGTYRVAGVVAGAVGNHTGVARVVFLNLEDDLHQVGADIGDLGKDAAGDTKCRSTEGFTDREADEARTGIVARDKEQNDEHHQEFHADEHHSDAHAGFEGNVVDRIRLAAQARESGPGVREGVDANAEPRHGVTASHSDEAEEKNDGQRGAYRLAGNGSEYAEIQNDDDSDEDPKEEEKFALGDQVGFAGFVDQLGDFPHGAVYGHVLQSHENGHAKGQTQDADDNPEQKKFVAVDTQEGHGRKIGQAEIGLTPGFIGWSSQKGNGGKQRQDCRGRKAFHKSTAPCANF